MQRWCLESTGGSPGPMAPPPIWGFANITNILVGFTSKFTDILEFTSKFTNILVNFASKLITGICNILVESDLDWLTFTCKPR